MWASPNTALGLALGALACVCGAQAQWRDGVVEFHGGALARLAARSGFGAITLGHVILGLSAGQLDALRAHEQAHVRQYERWGPLFLPAYLTSSAWQWLRGGRPHHDNAFERDARARERSPRRPGPAD